jgi:hypothetical protein
MSATFRQPSADPEHNAALSGGRRSDVQVRLRVIEEISREYRRPHVSKRIGQLLIVPAGLRAEHSADSVVCFVSTQAFGLSDRRCWHERDHLFDRPYCGDYGHSLVSWVALMRSHRRCHGG